MYKSPQSKQRSPTGTSFTDCLLSTCLHISNHFAAELNRPQRLHLQHAEEGVAERLEAAAPTAGVAAGPAPLRFFAGPLAAPTLDSARRDFAPRPSPATGMLALRASAGR